MISYIEAKKKAQDIIPDINACLEFPNAYRFFSKSNELTFGGLTDIVILKDNGMAVSFVEYVDKYAKGPHYVEKDFDGR